jgi:hypothetical protein
MAYGDRRNPWHPSTRTTSATLARGTALTRPGTGRAYVGRVGRVGDANVDLLPASISGAITAIASLGSGDGTPSDPRIIAINNAYNQALAGNSQQLPYPGTGAYYLQNWLTDVPAHPSYSNVLVQQKLSALQAAGRMPGALSSIANQLGLGGAAGGATIAGFPLVPALMLGALVYVLTSGETRRAPARSNPRGRRRRHRANVHRRRRRSRR